ncbi:MULTISPECIES: helix-turn-helix domain-containing protein [Clostridium]|uniref:helix-turn-helix domain-containing protein n=1 Tax=Clostridium TaxID=1485 RepID=UPI0008243031|nr:MULTISPECIES: helix-turn-helix domain-containing protein [Clostridium]PJI07481.1 AraC family transcriptional regulator [Clostridium sp. CT7]
MNNSKLRENIIHGNARFPLRVYANQKIGPKKELYCHWHEEVEFIYIEKGQANFNIDMNTVKVSKNQCVFVNSESIHWGYVRGTEECLYEAVVFNLKLLSGLLYDVCQSNFIDPILKRQYDFPVLPKESNREVADEMKNIVNSYIEKYNGWEVSIKASLLKIISLIAKYNEFKVKDGYTKLPDDYKIELIKKVLKFVEINYKNKIYVEELAEEVNMNEYYFCRFFKGITGKTPVEYINSFRIEEASRILRKSDKKVLDVALEVGFDNLSYFIKKFKEYKNCTPGKYRKLK